jgi:hypothetical protein
MKWSAMGPLLTGNRDDSLAVAMRDARRDMSVFVACVIDAELAN